MESQIDTTRCPLCGELNSCVMAGDGPDKETPCWCRAEIFPEELLQRIPPEQRRKACVCQKCVQAYHAAQAGESDV